MRKYLITALIAIVGLTGSISAIALGQSPRATVRPSRHHSTSASTRPPRVLFTTAPPGVARSVGLVALPDQYTAALVRRAYGKRALWAWRVSKQTFASVVNFKVAPGTMLYAEHRTLLAALRRFKVRLSSTPSAATTTTTTPAPSAGPSTPASESGPIEPVGVSGDWNLVFDDEFSGSSLNTDDWTPYWFSNGSTSNQTTMLESNVSVSNGNLNLNLDGSGGLVSSNGKFSFTYGFVEVRAYIPPATNGQVANWPAIWAVGQEPWPTDGELDIMEGLGGAACFHFHDDAGSPGGCARGSYTGWHTFAANWQPGEVTYYYDGQEVGTATEGITGQPMYLILENSSGSYGGPTVEPTTMEVDYVRVWSGS